MMRSPHSISAWRAPVVPTRMTVWAPSVASSSKALAVEPPPAPVEQHVTGTPPSRPARGRRRAGWAGERPGLTVLAGGARPGPLRGDQVGSRRVARQEDIRLHVPPPAADVVLEALVHLGSGRRRLPARCRHGAPP